MVPLHLVFRPANLGLAIRPVRMSPELKVDNSKLVVGDPENNGRIRIEIFNQYGSTGSNPGINQAQIKFTKNMVVTFRLSGLTDNMKEGVGSHVAGLSMLMLLGSKSLVSL